MCVFAILSFTLHRFAVNKVSSNSSVYSSFLSKYKHLSIDSDIVMKILMMNDIFKSEFFNLLT